MINNNIRIYNYSIVILLLLISACTKQIEKPILNFTYTTEGLSITLEGEISDPDSTVSQVFIEWGDSKTEKLIDSDYSQIEVSHRYAEPATYNIHITATYSEGDSTSQSITPVINYKETSLSNIDPDLFKTNDNEYLILTINLHTYQESHQSEKFNLITDIIGKMDVDFIALQECAQNKSATISEGIIREDNMALIISDRLKEKYMIDYNYIWDWAHYGWTVWEEGVAVLSKHPLVDNEARYVSSNTSTGEITSRKVIFGSYQLPGGSINIFSAHTHWRTSLTDEEQNTQIENIKLMVEEKKSSLPNIITFVCGDFNSNPTSDFPWSEGYNTMMKNDLYQDTFFEKHPDANAIPAQSIYNTIGGDFPGRIDYIFLKNDVRATVLESQIIFSHDVIGNVSDHYGVLTKVKIIW